MVGVREGLAGPVGIIGACGFKTVGEIVLTLAPQTAHNGCVVGAGRERVAEPRLSDARDIFVPGPVVGGGEHASRDSVDFRHAKMPMDVVGVAGCTGF